MGEQQWLVVRLKEAFPVEVSGGLTRWRILAEYYGKNGSRLSVRAVCLETAERITIADGRTRDVVHQVTSGIYAARGTTLYRICRRLVAEGRAHVIPMPRDTA
jgi:hypothetical protein